MQEIKLYVTTFCGFCVQAKRLLKQLNLDYTEINLDDDPELRMKLSQENGGWRTVPMIFIGEEFIGGFQELAALHSQGELLKKVKGD